MDEDTTGQPVMRRAEVVLAGLAVAFAVGLAVVGVASALETNEECSPYGYGGYSCVDYDDAELTVNPSTDLVDGQTVVVSGVAFDPPFATFVASQCVAADIALGGQGNCDSGTTTIRNVDSGGTVYFTMRVKRIIETPGLGPVDCAVEECVIGAATIDPSSNYPTVGGPSEDYVVIEGATAPLSFDPDAPPIDYEDAQIFVTPSENLVDRQTVTVTGIDLDPHFSSFGVALCDASLLGEAQVDACDLSTSRIGSVDGEGRAEIEMTVRRIITTSAGGEVDCAVPGACEIGGGTFSGFATAIEGARAPVHFDPDVPPVPPLEFEIEIDEVTADAVTGTATCNRDAEIQVDFSVNQEKAGDYASSYGYLYERAACDADGEEFTILLMSGDRRLTGGPATYSLWGYAYDGFEWVETQDSGEVSLRGGLRPAPVVESMDGVSTSIEIIGVEGRGAEQQLVVEVTCDRYAQSVWISASLQQWAGLDRVTAYGFIQFYNCDGIHRVSVPITPEDGVLVGGPAQVGVRATARDYRPPPDNYYDSASASGEVRLSGQLDGGDAFEPVPDPDSRITIDTVSRSAIEVTIECDEAVMVELYGYAIQQRGRNQNQASGYGFAECDGTTSFQVDLSSNGGGLSGGQAAIFISAYAYRIVQMDGYDYYEYVWDDMQQASVRVRGSR